jgi:guanylate kinase
MASTVAYCTMQGLVYAFSNEKTRPAGVYASILHAAQAALHEGKSVVIDADTATARELRKLGLPAAYIFVLPKDTQVLRDNLLAAYGGAEEDAAFAAALAFSERELEAMEKEDETFGFAVYDHTVTNSNESSALEELGGCLKGAYTAQKVRASCFISQSNTFVTTCAALAQVNCQIGVLIRYTPCMALGCTMLVA